MRAVARPVALRLSLDLDNTRPDPGDGELAVVYLDAAVTIEPDAGGAKVRMDSEALLSDVADGLEMVAQEIRDRGYRLAGADDTKGSDCGNKE